MPERKTNPTLAKTNLARERIASGLTQVEMAEYLGLSLRNYRRLESGVREPLLAELVNCSLVLGVTFEQVAPDNWREWKQFGPRVPSGPGLSRLLIDDRRGRWKPEQAD